MTLENLKTEQENIIKEIQNLKGANCTPIPDGIIDVEKYLYANPKILWINKEVNSEDDKDCWSLIDVLNDLPNLLTNEKGWNKTFNPIVYTLFGVYNEIEWEEMPFISEKPEIANVMKNIAYVNVKKLPGKSIANHNEVKQHFSENDILRKQIKLFKPQVIICGGTFDLLDNLFEEIFGNDYDKMNVIKDNKARFFYDNNLMIVDTYHPSNRSLGEEIYCNTIIKNVCNWILINKSK